MLPDALDGEFLCPIRPHVVYVQSSLLRAQVFQILPHATMHPLNPRALPREVVAEDVGVTKKKGRPSRRERIKKARDSLVALDGWCEGVLGSPSGTRGRYVVEKTALVDVIGGDERWEGALGGATARVVERMIGVID
jgi:hypothetical protein